MIYIALGANLEWRGCSPAITLRCAVDAMREHRLSIVSGSPLYITAPVPVSDQPWFHNAVVALEEGPPPHELLQTLNEIEAGFGRERGAPNAPRILDLDIIAYHDEVIVDDRLEIPHPRMQERAFVLCPLRDLDPRWLHPIDGVAIRHYIDMLPPEQEIQRLSAPPVHHSAHRSEAINV
jgi:2-amino-4-hydroxy-6-hydroxymethyldihydropteridine diphosphokinase